jgi:hypothetical protein
VGLGEKIFLSLPPEMWGFGDDINCGFVVLIFEQGCNCHFINVKIIFLVI